ncbi:hypothetical protein [Ktedonobacter racemifer]|uniref:Uncharacterized protein n=1 Tax=Ktedonobacter racemifer DSM 44963 TaxID=485913 RepID=D6TWU4_KTERA|nr:hypothetical protein [Ktedonobacter racemifer]EFH84677.1 hypothetical protein Krac_5776 [Ktedonobacter racemifer DSM 44963]
MPRRKKHLQYMSLDEIKQEVQDYEERRQRRNARRRERRQWLKTAPREETCLRYRGEEKPCDKRTFLKAERFVLQCNEKYPEFKGDAVLILLTLSHNILHLRYPDRACGGDSLADCPLVSLHVLCYTALEVAFNYRLDPGFKLGGAQIAQARLELASGLDRERLRFNTLLGDLSIDL